jgi:hypothetical protein
MELARSRVGSRLCAPLGSPSAVADPEGALNQRVVRIGWRELGRPGRHPLQGRLGSAAVLAGRGKRDRGLRRERALVRPGDQAAQVRERRAADPTARHAAGKLVEELLRQLDRQARELLLRGGGLRRREPGRVLERSGIACRSLVRAAAPPGIASTATPIIAITNVSITTTPRAGLRAVLGLAAAIGSSGSSGYLVYWILGSLITW